MKLFAFFIWALSLPVSVQATLPPDDSLALDRLLELKPDIQKGRQHFTLCTKCHGTEGWGSSNGEYPQLAGQHPSVIIKQLRDILTGQRDNLRMLAAAQELVKDGPEAIVDVAAYISTLKMNPEPDIGDADDQDLDQIARLNASVCSQCHGANGEGDAEKIYPLIQGQNYKYLLRQLTDIKHVRRKNANAEMTEQLHDLSINDLQLLADYFSRIEPTEDKIAPFGWRNPDFQ